VSAMMRRTGAMSTTVRKVFACETFGLQAIDFIDSGFCEKRRNMGRGMVKPTPNPARKVFACETFASQVIDFIESTYCGKDPHAGFTDLSQTHATLTPLTQRSL